ncbi:phage head closure protein [Enterobacter sp. R-1.6.2]|uniref:phage head closure protein n=1 Tax=Enterobacter TaxID=547 RepID=UPI001A934BB4|nr:MULTISPECIES: phage head closure protein [Enterobacter]MEB2381351.1 phage head closure protein [Enterobacter sp. R-1.5.3]MEB2430367.1 phage head closure protein [Enterobacter sp. R-1.6.2]WIK25521.1 phage head closure protein [Enterobacter asburiae]BCT18532.1 head-tail adaptor protein [Enterobacter asburiae]HCR1900820.1 phage head closure protein [Enterobacter asburiae]
MQAGRLRDRITVQNLSSERDSSGQPVESWHDAPETWAEVKGISGRELVAAGAETAIATIRVWTRFRRDITAASRIRVETGPFKGAVLNIVGPPIPDSRGVLFEILCKQGAEK